MSVFVQSYSEDDGQVVEISLDGGGTVLVKKYKDGSVKIIATSSYDIDNPKIIEMNGLN